MDVDGAFSQRCLARVNEAGMRAKFRMKLRTLSITMQMMNDAKTSVSHGADPSDLPPNMVGAPGAEETGHRYFSVD